MVGVTSGASIPGLTYTATVDGTLMQSGPHREPRRLQRSERGRPLGGRIAVVERVRGRDDQQSAAHHDRGGRDGDGRLRRELYSVAAG
jgi:hypothetical protein